MTAHCPHSGAGGLGCLALDSGQGGSWVALPHPRSPRVPRCRGKAGPAGGAALRRARWQRGRRQPRAGVCQRRQSRRSGRGDGGAADPSGVMERQARGESGRDGARGCAPEPGGRAEAREAERAARRRPELRMRAGGVPLPAPVVRGGLPGLGPAAAAGAPCRAELLRWRLLFFFSLRVSSTLRGQGSAMATSVSVRVLFCLVAVLCVLEGLSEAWLHRARL